MQGTFGLLSYCLSTGRLTMRTLCLLILTIGISACASSLERQAGTASKGDCRDQARNYVQANMATIANEWRAHEEYKQYQKCLARQNNASS